MRFSKAITANTYFVTLFPEILNVTSSLLFEFDFLRSLTRDNDSAVVQIANIKKKFY